MSSAWFAVFMGCSLWVDAEESTCPAEGEKFLPDVPLDAALEDEPDGTEAEGMLCTGQVEAATWDEWVEASSGYDRVVLHCDSRWCDDAYAGRYVCALNGTLEAWVDQYCPACEIKTIPEHATPLLEVWCAQ